jgi:CHAT domain-containing protein
MASGSDTALLSRWPVGGDATFRMLREFVQELPFQSASAAWQRSVLIGRNNLLDPEREPRLGSTSLPLEAKAVHPIFWAGYLLGDTGIVPEN